MCADVPCVFPDLAGVHVVERGKGRLLEATVDYHIVHVFIVGDDHPRHSQAERIRDFLRGLREGKE